MPSRRVFRAGVAGRGVNNTGALRSVSGINEHTTSVLLNIDAPAAAEAAAGVVGLTADLAQKLEEAQRSDAEARAKVVAEQGTEAAQALFAGLNALRQEAHAARQAARGRGGTGRSLSLRMAAALRCLDGAPGTSGPVAAAPPRS